MQDNDRITIRLTPRMRDKVDKKIKKENMFLNRSELIRHLLQNFLAEPYHRKGKRLRR